MSKIKDEQFSAEVEKRLQNLFSDSDEVQGGGKLGEGSDEVQQGDKIDEGSDDQFSSEEDILDEISEEDLLEDETFNEDTIEEISEDDLLDDDLGENALDDDLSEDLLDDDFSEDAADDLDNDLLDDDLNEDLFDESPGDNPDTVEHGDVSIKEDGEFHFYPFRLLKSIILSIDWEITDDIMDRLVSQVTGLMETYKNDRFVLIFLHLLWELGKYIKKHRGQSHPNSIKTLNSVYNALEKILSSKELSDTDKKRILSVEMVKFKTLKEQITLQHVDPSENAAATQAKVVGKADGKMDEKTISMEMTEMIRTVVRAELKSLIKEFADWANRR